MRRFLSVIALSLCVVPAALANPTVSFTLAGTAGANGWYRSDVTIYWTITEVEKVTSTSPDCQIAQLVAVEGTPTRTCVAYFAGGSASATASLKIDKTPPTGVAGALARAPDANGWFNHPVAAAFAGQDAVSGIAGCSQPTYAGVDSASASLTGTCTDVAGNTSGAASVSFRYDATPPAVTPAPERRPDRGSWYRRPVTIQFAGTDLTSGIASCSAPARYAGPDRAKAAVVGSCRDAAGNVAEAGLAFDYDATPPALTQVRAEIAGGTAKVTWQRAADAASVEIFRTPGVNGARRTNVYRGRGTVFTDKTVKKGVRYRYEVAVADAAGNVRRKLVAATVRKPLYSPAWGSVLKPRPVVLRWRAVAGARFYNLQLFRNGRKVLTAWPRRAPFTVGTAWRTLGKRQQLLPGRYRWYVWPARGTRATPRYGPPLGTSVFVVRR